MWNSAKIFSGVCLNDGLEKGPDLINNLFLVLIRWRKSEFAILGDIKCMFNQIAIAPEDRPYFSFYWQNYNEKESSVYEWCRLIFGSISSPDIASSGIQFLAKETEDDYPIGCEILKNSIYVDDISPSFNEENEAIKAGKEVNEILGKGSFMVKQWHSNSKFIENQLNKEIVVTESKTLMLGHMWNKEQDTFNLKIRDIPIDKKNVTKRSILRCIASIWDPLGLVNPVMVNLRIPFQQLWRRSLEWDETLPEDEAKDWCDMFEEVNKKLYLEIPRCLIMNAKNIEIYEIHTFSDGSEVGFGACSFLRFVVDGVWVVKFIASKALLTPIKGWTIPRTELVGLLIGTRLAKSINIALDITSVKLFFWVDSQVILHWIKSSSHKYKAFVEKRLAEIAENCDPSRILYVPSKINPADVLTKECTKINLKEWYEGPQFLKSDIEESMFNTPKFDSFQSFDENEIKKPRKVKKKKFEKKHISNLQTKEVSFRNENYEQVLEKSDMSDSWFEALNAVHELENTKPIQTLQERKLSKEKILRALQHGVNIEKGKDYLNLCPILDESCGIWKVGSRLRRLENWNADILMPVILPKISLPMLDKYCSQSEDKKVGIIRKLLVHYHESGLHLCANRINSDIQRAGFWLIGAIKLLKNIEYRCMYCRKLKRPLLNQKMGEIPAYRFKPYSIVFEFTSTDMFGPIQVKINKRTVVKGHIAIFVCMTTRAIHMEMCYDHEGGEGLSTKSFLFAFRRFISCRGVQASIVYSDQGTNFTGAIKLIHATTEEWNKIVAQEIIQMTNHEVEWKWNCPSASHMNGSTERMVRWARQALAATIDYHIQSFFPFEWFTFLAEATYLINSRPLFPNNSTDPLDDSGYISANLILFGHSRPVPQYSTEETYDPHNHLKVVQNRIQIFWEAFVRYMPKILTVRKKWTTEQYNVKVGDYVILQKESLQSFLPRSLWDVGVIIETHPGKDGLVRRVTVKTRKGEYQRPIHKMCLVATKEEIDANFVNNPDPNIDCQHIENVSNITKKGEC